jgi:hypothetical protein
VRDEKNRAGNIRECLIYELTKTTTIMEKEELKKLTSTLKLGLGNIEYWARKVNKWLKDGKKIKVELWKQKRGDYTFQDIPDNEFEKLIEYEYWQVIYKTCRNIVDVAEKAMKIGEDFYEAGQRIDTKTRGRLDQAYHQTAKDALELEKYIKATKLKGED